MRVRNGCTRRSRKQSRSNGAKVFEGTLSKRKKELEEKSNDFREAYTQNVRQMVTDHSNEVDHLKSVHQKQKEEL